MADSWRTWLETGRLIEGRHLGQSGDTEASPVCEYAIFGATDADFDVETLIADILGLIYDQTHGGGCRCDHLRVALWLEQVAEGEIVATAAFQHGGRTCPAFSRDEWLALEQAVQRYERRIQL
jgi:hypothetical protein